MELQTLKKITKQVFDVKRETVNMNTIYGYEGYENEVILIDEETFHYSIEVGENTVVVDLNIENVTGEQFYEMLIQIYLLSERLYHKRGVV